MPSNCVRDCCKLFFHEMNEYEQIHPTRTRGLYLIRFKHTCWHQFQRSRTCSGVEHPLSVNVILIRLRAKKKCMDLILLMLNIKCHTDFVETCRLCCTRGSGNAYGHTIYIAIWQVSCWFYWALSSELTPDPWNVYCDNIINTEKLLKPVHDWDQKIGRV